MRKLVSVFILTLLFSGSAFAQFKIENKRPVFGVTGKNVVTVPQEGLWSVATGWQDDWMCGWKHADPQKVEQSGEWTILSGCMQLPECDLILRDSYRQIIDGLVQ